MDNKLAAKGEEEGGGLVSAPGPGKEKPSGALYLIP